MSANLLSR